VSELVTIGDVVERSTGTRNPALKPNVEFMYVDVAGVDNVRKVVFGARPVMGSDAPSRARKVIRTGDVLVSTVRPNLNAVALVPPDLDGQIASTGFCVLRATSRVLPEYLFFFARSRRFIDGLTKLVAGAMYPAVSDGQVLAQALPLPSIDDQREIVDLLSRAEGIVRLLREAQKKAAEIIPALFLDMFGDPAMNPKNWPTRSLGELVAFVSGGTPSKAREDFWIGDLPWVSPKDMKTIALYDATDHLNQVVLAETNLKLIPVGSVLIVVRGMILIHTVPVAHARVPMTINQDMKALVPRSSIDSSYLVWALKVSHRHLLNMVSTAAHGTKKLDTARLEELVVPLPPLDVQSAFGLNLARIESVQAQQRAAQSRAEATFNSLLVQVFSGAESMASPPLPEEAATA